MTVKICMVCICLFTLSALGVAAKEKPAENPQNRIARPYSPELYSSTEQFEYEFEWLDGQIVANPQ